MCRPWRRSPTTSNATVARHWAESGGADRQVSIVHAGRLKTMEVRVEVPVEDMTRLTDQDEDSARGQNSIWPAIYPRLLQLIRQHRSTIVFVNSRRLSERIAARVNEL